MARKSPPASSLQPTDDDEEMVSRSQAEDEQDESLKQINEVLSANDLAGGTMRLYRRGPTERSFSYLDKIPISEFDIDYIKKVYGGGDYQGKTYRANGQMGKGVSFSIDPRFRGAIDASDPKVRETAQQIDLPKLITALNDGKQHDDGSQVRDMMAMMQKSSENTMMMMMQMMQQSTQTMVAAIQAIGSRPADTTMSTIVPVILEMVRHQGGKTSSMTEVIEAMRAVKELSAGDAPEKEDKDDEESFGLKLIKGLLPVLGGMGGVPSVQPMKRLPGTSGNAAAASPVKETSTAQPVQPAQPTPASDPQAQMVSMFLGRLVTASESGSDVGLYHDLVIESLSPDQFAQIMGVVQQDDWLEQLYGSDPNILARVKIQVKWFESLRSMLVESFKESHESTQAGETDDADGGSGGVETDAHPAG